MRTRELQTLIASFICFPSCIGAALVKSGTESPPTVAAASESSKEAGVLEFVCSVESESEGPSIWFCQVVGSRAAAGWITITTPRIAQCGGDGGVGIVVTVQSALAVAPLEVRPLGRNGMRISRSGELLAELPALGGSRPAIPGLALTRGLALKPATPSSPTEAQVRALAELAKDPSWSVLTRAMADPNLSALLHQRMNPDATKTSESALGAD